MNCSCCGKPDLQEFEEIWVNEIYHVVCKGDNAEDCNFRIQQAILRTIHLLREQNGLTLFDNGVPMNPEINGVGGANPHVLMGHEVHHDDPLWFTFMEKVKEFATNLVEGVYTCVVSIINLAYKLLDFIPNLVRRRS